MEALALPLQPHPFSKTDHWPGCPAMPRDLNSSREATRPVPQTGRMQEWWKTETVSAEGPDPSGEDTLFSGTVNSACAKILGSSRPQPRKGHRIACMPALGGLRQEDRYEFQTCLVCRWRPCLKRKKSGDLLVKRDTAAWPSGRPAAMRGGGGRHPSTISCKFKIISQQNTFKCRNLWRKKNLGKSSWRGGRRY